ncbi:MAG: hypothetical protein ACRC6I_05140, partial [Paracoccaceae bacterium]
MANLTRLLSLFAAILLFSPQPASARLTQTALLIMADRCAEGDAAACTARFIATGEAPEGFDTAALMARLSASCTADDLTACTDAAAAKMWAGQLDDPQVYIGLSRGCVSGDGWGCDMLGTLRLFAPFPPQNGYAALHKLKRDACEAKGDAAACVDYAYLNETVSGVPPDPDARVGGLETACAAGQHRACTYLSYL